MTQSGAAYKTLVWCLPRSSTARLVITTEDGDVHAVSLSIEEVVATRDALNVAFTRMELP